MNTGTVSKYFSGKGGGKRKPSSSSSVSDACNSPENNSKTKSESKKQRQCSDIGSSEDMALQETLSEIKAAMSKLATKEDVERLTAALTVRIEKLESSVFDLENEKDKLREEISKVRGENAELQSRLSQCSKEANQFKSDLNDQEQHGRQWNLRVFGVREVQGEETVEDCVKKCVDVFSKKIGAPVTANDVETAHRSGKVTTGGGRPRPIIVRFFSRRQRGLVLTNRRKLKQTGISIGEDLTQANYKLSQKVHAHSATMATWSSNGKILTKLKNGKTVRVYIDTNIDTLFMKEMA